jgi:Tol biopolymer transport system component/lysophospholipase L1-like esterase
MVRAVAVSSVFLLVLCSIASQPRTAGPALSSTAAVLAGESFTEDQVFHILVLGDSYSAGNGAGHYAGPKGCYRSRDNYGGKLAHFLNVDGIVPSPAVATAACSGATAAQIYQAWPEKSVPRQIDAIRPTTDLILLTVGGNDAHFKDIVLNCLVRETRDANDCDGSLDLAEHLLNSGVLRTSITRALDRISAMAGPDTGIGLLGYPQLEGDAQFRIRHGYIGRWVQAGRRLRELQDRASKVEADIIADYQNGERFHFIDVQPMWDGPPFHGLYADGRDAPNSWLVKVASSISRETYYHPNPTGWAKNGKLLAGNAWVRRVFTRTVAPTITSSPLPSGVVGAPYTAKLSTTDGRVGTWSVDALPPSASTIPPGLSLAGPTISGTPQQVGTWSFSVRFTDSRGRTTTRKARVVVRDDPGTPSDGVLSALSSASDGDTGNQESADGAISDNGEYAVFTSRASDLGPDDENGLVDIYFRDLTNGATHLVTRGYDGTDSDGGSANPDISGDGRFVVFVSDANNLVPDDTHAGADLFVWDGSTDAISRITGPEGRPVDGLWPVTDDAGDVAFVSGASNLVPSDANERDDVFLWNRALGRIERVSPGNAPGQPDRTMGQPSISADGTVVAYSSLARDLVSGDTNGADDVFAWERQTNTTTRISTTSSGDQLNAGSAGPVLSANGRFVAFESEADTLVAGDTNSVNDIFVLDRETESIRRVNISSGGAQANAVSNRPSISADGRFVAYTSAATNLSGEDADPWYDAFMWDGATGSTTLLSAAPIGSSNGSSTPQQQSISADGSRVVFDSFASNLVEHDTNGTFDVMLWSRSP